MASGTSYNGWPGNSDPKAIDVVKFGDAQGLPFPGGVKAGDVFTVLGYVAVQFNARVEPIVSGWDWGYSWKQNVNNPSQLSCHASGTAIDLNAPDHPNGSSGTFTNAQVGQIYAILNEVQGAVDWLEGYDEMHFEISVNASTLARVAASLPGTTPPGDWFDQVDSNEFRTIMTECLAPVVQRLDSISGSTAHTDVACTDTYTALKGGEIGTGTAEAVGRVLAGTVLTVKDYQP